MFMMFEYSFLEKNVNSKYKSVYQHISALIYDFMIQMIRVFNFSFGNFKIELLNSVSFPVSLWPGLCDSTRELDHFKMLSFFHL